VTHVPRTDRRDGSASGIFEWSHGGDPYLAAYREMFLLGAFATPAWTVVVSELQTDYLRLLAGFRSTFLLSIGAALTLVTLLSTVQIRRSLGPLQQLKSGAEKMSGADFDVRVSIESGDEFEDVGAAFNQMAQQLGRQFTMLTAVTAIERSALSSSTQDEIVETILFSLLSTFDLDTASLCLIEDQRLDSCRSYSVAPGRRMSIAQFELSESERAELEMSPNHFLVEGQPPRYMDFGANTEGGADRFLLLPIYRDTRLAGVVALGSCGTRNGESVDVDQARQISDHAALALANVRLIVELDELQIGSLTALARAVDAKSPWTAGHSERVTALSVAIGEALGLSTEELASLRRGGLLHDIGKIGVPAHVLDKPGALTPEEWRMMQEHPMIGVRILEPLGAFHDIIPIVREHHEKLDGTGYPDGKSGGEIHLLARVLAVADVFDAVTSERPYRSGKDPKWVIDLIQESAGTHFDPVVVDAFLKIVAGSHERLLSLAATP
jgi:putative nucleotidyltransferase with HDIG domain